MQFGVDVAFRSGGSLVAVFYRINFWVHRVALIFQRRGIISDGISSCSGGKAAMTAAAYRDLTRDPASERCREQCLPAGPSNNKQLNLS